MNVINKYFKGDPNIWAIIVGLSVFSLLAVYSSTGTLAYSFKQGNTAIYILRHSGFLAVGITIAFVLHIFPYKYYARISQWLMALVIPLLIITLVTSFRWLKIFGISFQTSDFAKMALIMYLAQQLALRQAEILDFKKTLLPMFSVIVVVCGLIFPTNFSTAGLLFAVSVLLLFVGRVSLKQLSGLCAISLVAVTILLGSFYGLQKKGVDNAIMKVFRTETWVNRIDRFIGNNPENTDLNENFQSIQAKIAVGTGGFIGKGPGNSVQRNFLPQPFSDFIFAIIIEEYGVLGGIIVLFLYLTLLYRSILIVRKCDKTFPAFLVMGLSLSIVFQALVNMAVAVGLMPVTGQPLPFISWGGTSMLFTGAAFGIILSVSREMRKDDEVKNRKSAEKQPPEEPESATESEPEEEYISQTE